MSDNTLSQALVSQMLAGLFMLKDCIDRCPDKEWNQSHNDYPFSQVIFHTLFDCDFNLCDERDDIKKQEFHINNKDIFANYEELTDEINNNIYERNFINSYYEHCINKIVNVIESNNEQMLFEQNMDVYKNMTKVERYINSIRHIQHHAAQLGFRIQNLLGQEMKWKSRGYENKKR
jgi:hypothetical protein